MYLHYVFELKGYVGRTGANDPDDVYGTFEQDYDYEIVVGFNTLFAYLKEEVIGEYTFKNFTKEKQEGFKRSLELCFELGLINTEDLEEDDDFIKWAKEYFEEEAHEKAQEDYGD